MVAKVIDILPVFFSVPFKFTISMLQLLAGVERSWLVKITSTRCVLMFSATYSLSVTPMSPSDLLFSSLKHPLHLHISIRVMVRLLCVIRVENNINNNNKNNSSLWSREERREKRSLIMYIKARCWSGLCFHCVHAKVVSDPAHAVLALRSDDARWVAGSAGHFLKDENSNLATNKALS